MVSLVASTVGLLVYVYLIGWVLTWVRLAAARLPSDLATSALDNKQLLGVGLRTTFFMGVIFAGACVVAYVAAARNWAANGPDWHALIGARGVRRARKPLEEDEAERRVWQDKRERALARARGCRADRVAAAARLVRVAPALERWATERRERALAIAGAESPVAAARATRLRRRSRALGLLRRTDRAQALAKQAKAHEKEAGLQIEAPPAPAPPPGDRAVQVLAGFNNLVISAVIGLAAGRFVDLIPWASWLTLLVGALVAFGVWSALIHWGPLLARPWAHGVAWIVVAAAAVLVAAPLGLLVIGSVAVSTLGRPLARRPPPRSLSELLRSPLPWALLSFYTLVGVAYYATPPVSFQRAVVTTSSGERVGGYLSRSAAGVYLVSCTPLADATSTGERVDLVPAATIKSVTLGGPETRLDSGERPSLATLGLSALGVEAHVESLVHPDLRARHGTCGGAQPASLTAAQEDPALGAGVIVGTGPPRGQAHDGEPPIETKPTPPLIAKLARLYQPTVEVSVADRFWPVSVGAVLRDVGRDRQATCIVRYPSRECKELRQLKELKPQGSSRRDFLRFPAPRRSDPSNQFRAFLNGQYIFPGLDHRWLADPGLLHPWNTAQVYFFYAGPLTSTETWPGNARNPDVEPGMTGLEYWFFYPYNYYPTIISSALMDEAPIAGEHVNTDLHQGDWEHVTVLLDPKTFAPRWLYMARHADEGSFLPWDSPTLSFDGATHPIVQAAYGGHPTYDDHCGARPRGRLFYLSSDWVVCGGGRYAFRAASTPLVDLAQTSWGCWQGFFGEADKWWKPKALPESDNIVNKGLELIYAPGPRSPLWQGENERLLNGKDICVGEQQRKPEEAAIGALRRVSLP